MAGRLPSISLNNLEKQDLLKQDPWAELMDRIKELNLPLPSKVDGNHPKKESDWFKVKAYIETNNAVHRSMITADPEDYLSEFNELFKKADELGEALFAKQTKRAEDQQRTELQPVQNWLDSNIETMRKMKEESESLLKVVTPVQEVEAIREKAISEVTEKPVTVPPKTLT